MITGVNITMIHLYTCLHLDDTCFDEQLSYLQPLECSPSAPSFFVSRYRFAHPVQQDAYQA